MGPDNRLSHDDARQHRMGDATPKRSGLPGTIVFSLAFHHISIQTGYLINTD